MLPAATSSPSARGQRTSSRNMRCASSGRQLVAPRSLGITSRLGSSLSKARRTLSARKSAARYRACGLRMPGRTRNLRVTGRFSASTRRKHLPAPFRSWACQKISLASSLQCRTDVHVVATILWWQCGLACCQALRQGEFGARGHAGGRREETHNMGAMPCQDAACMARKDTECHRSREGAKEFRKMV